jgi:hypothetical protein
VSYRYQLDLAVCAEKYVTWAKQFGFDGYLLDAEFKVEAG